MKKFTALLLAVLLVCSLGAAASAQSANTPEREAALRESTMVQRASIYCMNLLQAAGAEDLDMRTSRSIEAAMYEALGWKVTFDKPVDLGTLGIAPDVLELANSDYFAAGEEMKKKIFDARRVVIQKCGWYDDINGISFDMDLEERSIRYYAGASEQYPGWGFMGENSFVSYDEYYGSAGSAENGAGLSYTEPHIGVEWWRDGVDADS